MSVPVSVPAPAPATAPLPRTSPPSDLPDPTVLVLEGPLGAAQADALRIRLVEAVDAAPGALLLDAHAVTEFSDEAMTALTAARSRAKFRGTRIAVLDSPDGAMTAGLRRTGRHFRFPVHPDAEQATAALAAEWAALQGRSLRLVPALPDADDQDPVSTVANPDRNTVD